MESNKYYTPEIEEFHVGFEYEYEDINESGGSLSWYKGVIKEGECYIIDQLLEYEDLQFRVKYLDKEDIESLGFTRRTISRSEFSKIISDTIFIIKPYWTYNLSKKEDLVRIYTGIENNFPYSEIFIGNIKNKSELKKLLKQLKIDDTQ